jgi:SagB-type dehydrogenase family enzyme
MKPHKWRELLVPSSQPGECWEIFHENSKSSRFDTNDTETVRSELTRLHESLPYQNLPKIELPNKVRSLDLSLGDAICTRRSIRKMDEVVLDLETVATLLYYSYGLTGKNEDVPRFFRAVPSAGALYPLELYLYSGSVKGLQPGFYHYNPCENHLSRLVRRVENAVPICSVVRQPELVMHSSMIIFITAMFHRTAFKYHDRGYRFALMEAGHVAQNLQLILQALGLAGVGIGGFYDRDVDRLLGLDGLTHSTLYMVAVGGNATGSNGEVN